MEFFEGATSEEEVQNALARMLKQLRHDGRMNPGPQLEAAVFDAVAHILNGVRPARVLQRCLKILLAARKVTCGLPR